MASPAGLIGTEVADRRSDEYCPHCDNHFVIEAKTPQPALEVEGEDARVDSRYLFLDGRLRVSLTGAECSRTTE